MTDSEEKITMTNQPVQAPSLAETNTILQQHIALLTARLELQTQAYVEARQDDGETIRFYQWRMRCLEFGIQDFRSRNPDIKDREILEKALTDNGQLQGRKYFPTGCDVENCSLAKREFKTPYDLPTKEHAK